MEISKLSLIECIQRWGNFSSIALLDPHCSLFSCPDIQGVIGYRLHAQCVVVFGDPVCPPENILPLVQAFHDFCATCSRSIVYVTASEQFTHWLQHHKLCGCVLGIGEETILNPMLDPMEMTGKKAGTLRTKYTHSVDQGMSVHEYTENDPALEKALTNIKDCWLNQRKGPQIFLNSVDIFEHRSNKRYFYVKHQDQIIAFMMLNRLSAYDGWVMNVSMRMPDAEPTTSEFLVLSVLNALRDEQCSFFSVGTAPALELGRTDGLTHFQQYCARGVFKIAHKLFNLGGRQFYWSKFNPQKAPTFVTFSRSRISIRDLIGIMRAFNVY